MRLIGEVKAAGKHLALMAHSSHSRELEPDIAQLAVKRILDAGAVIRCQAPLIRKVNDDANVWAQLWRKQVQLGMVPYYMFVERDTGAKAYFEVPLARAYKVFTEAYSQVSGLCRTARTVDVGLTRQGADGRYHRGGRREGVRAEIPAGPRPAG